jgi:hypothetical protein
LCAFRSSSVFEQKGRKLFIKYRLVVRSKAIAEATPGTEEFILFLLPGLSCPIPGIGSVPVLTVPVSLAVRVTAV